MLSSLFPRSSIYKSIDVEGERHAFDGGNTALFHEADEVVEDGTHLDHAQSSNSGITASKQQRHGYRHQQSFPDPFEQIPKTGAAVPQLPLIVSAPPSPSASLRNESHDREEDIQVQDGHARIQGSLLDPFAAHHDSETHEDDPMAALSRRMNAPLIGELQHDASEHGKTHDQDVPGIQYGPPQSLMFGSSSRAEQTAYETAESQYQATPSASRLQASPSIARSPLASSSHILQQSKQVPWWLRDNRKRIGEMADASIGGSIRLEASSHRSSYRPDVKRSIPEESTSSPATHTMFLPTHTSPSLPHSSRIATGPTSNIGTFVQNMYNVSQGILSASNSCRRGPIHLQTHLSKKDKALWNWVNVEDLDSFLQEVYTFYVKKGIWSIALAGFLDLLTIGFVIGFSIFLLGCVDYSVIRGSHHMSEVVVPRCVSRFHGTTLFLFLSLACFYALRIVKFGQIIKKLFMMRDFFTELLEIPESDIQTVPWPVIVDKISLLRSEHPSVAPHQDFSSMDAGDEAVPAPPSINKPRLDAHDVANRIMRKENYFIALFNKNVINTAIPIPPLLAKSRSFTFLAQKLGLVTMVITAESGRNVAANIRGADNASVALLTKVLEWNLTFCLLGFLFGPDGQVRRQFVSERNKKELVQALQRRFILMGFINAIFAPFIILYLLFYSFFRYFEEYHKNPSSLGTRSYTQLARWKFREFNELPHIFQMRLHRSYPLADAYISQFPNDRMAQLARFTAFISGSFASVLVLFSLVDPDAFLHFEITKDRTVLFYIGIFGSIMAIARGMVPDDHRVVDSEALMREVIEETHYMPNHWRGKLHSADVHREFSLLFPYKIAIFFHEILSVLTTPLVLWFTLPRSATQIIDFFREFTIHVDGLGYVCSFAVFDFAKTGLGDMRYGAPPVKGPSLTHAQRKATSAATSMAASSEVETIAEDEEGGEEQEDERADLTIDERFVSDQGKLEKSILGFKAANPNWQPQDQSTSLYLSRMTELASNSVFLLPRPATRTEASHHRPNSGHLSQRSGSRLHVSTRRSRHFQPSPFTSPILEDEDPLPGSSGSRDAGVVSASSMVDGGRRGDRGGGQVHYRAAYARAPRQQQPQPTYQDYSHSKYSRHPGFGAAATLIEEESQHGISHNEEMEEDDADDPYIQPRGGSDAGTEQDRIAPADITGVGGG